MVYLTPVFEAWSNHRYDAVSFDRVDPLLGGDEALARLIDAVHARGLRLMGDLTTNHTGDHHDWFLEAQRDPDSVERVVLPVRHRPEDARLRGLARHPVAAEARPLLGRARPASVRRHRLGRRHVARARARRLAHRRRQHDRPARGRRPRPRRGPRAAPDDGRGPAGLLAARRARPRRDARPDGPRLARHDGLRRLHPTGLVLAQRRLARPGPASGTVSTTSGLPVDIPVLPAEAAVATMRDAHGAMPWASWSSSTMHLDSHDTPRFRTVTGGGIDGGIDADGLGRGRHLVGLGLQMTMPGVPVVFMGDELGPHRGRRRARAHAVPLGPHRHLGPADLRRLRRVDRPAARPRGPAARRPALAARRRRRR